MMLKLQLFYLFLIVCSINEKYIIQGGQEPATFISFLNKILTKENQNEASG